MTFLPIVARELRVAARRRSTFRTRNGAALVSILVMIVTLGLLELQYSAAHGKSLFSALTVMAFGYCLLAGTRATSDCVSSEKRAGTIGLLFLTGLKGYDVILGKLVSCALAAFYGLLATVPVIALALPLGGVTAGEVVRMALLFLNTLFLSMAAGVLASTVSRNDRRALIATACIIIAVAGAPYVLAVGWAIWLETQGRPPNSLWDFAAVLKPSPLFAFQIARFGFVTRSLLADFYSSLLLTHLIAWLLLAAASWIVPHVCRERLAGRLGSRWLRIDNRWRYGSPAKRQAWRKRLLDRNAFYWLAARDRIKAHCVWFFVLAMGGIWCWVGWRLQSFIFDWDTSLWLLFLLFAFFKLWFASEVCSHWVEHRESGAFEFLLSSPLQLKDLTHGHALALWRQFGWPIVLILALSSLLMVSALQASHHELTGGEVRLLFLSLMLMLVADLLTLNWVGIWQGVTTSQIHRAITATCLRVLLVPTLIFLALYAIGCLIFLVFWPQRQNSGTWGLTGLLWLTVGLSTNLFFGLRSRQRFLNQFREVATQRFHAPSAELDLWPKFFQALRGPFQKRPIIPADGMVDRSPGKRWWLRGTALLVLILAMAFGGWRYHISREVRAQLAGIRAARQPVTSADLKTWLPFVPEDQNAGAILQRAAPLLWLPNQWPRPARLPLLHSASGLRKLTWAGSSDLPTPELQATVSNVVARNRQGIRMLHKAAALTNSRMPLDWTHRAPNLAVTRQVAKLRPAGPLLQMESWLALIHGDPQGAADIALVLFGLARAMEQEPLHVAQHERVLHLNAALGLLERIMSEHPLPGTLLEQFTQRLDEAAGASGPALSRAYMVERCLEIEAFQSLGKPSAARWNRGRSRGQELLISALNSAGVILGLRDRVLLRYLERMPPLIERAQQIGRDDLPRLVKSAVSVRNPRAAALQPADAAQQYWENLLDQQLHLVAQLRVASIAVAIERFRVAHQRLPASLEELQPQFLSRVPTDPFGAGSFQYELLNPGFSVRASGGRSQPRNAQLYGDLSFTVER